MASPQTVKRASWAYAEQHRGDDPVLAAARQRAAELGVSAVSGGTAAALTTLAAAAGARTLVEVGTGAGISGVSLLRGAAADAVLTSIDVDADRLHAARTAFRDGGFPAGRTRLITGRAEEVLPRMSPGGYDLVLLDGDPRDVVDNARHALRMLRDGGMLIVVDALADDTVPRPAVRDGATVQMRRVEQMLLEDEHLVTSMLGTGTGLLVAVTRRRRR
ncbi:O-methyltransferase [Nesterenkonia aerolata]|uniref:Class I SAM-dependent methyltransferase n=1 Tax=Nesterenkonia aerolata TaxID=3074079 RepID=A0ABU2DP20_9MICC|nr:class I SAM-dependent methyltransferase [Nesterenkonia sp. LY-0111]MDR8018188.1 class I SAM-dependent methyltransferase [Nesterenkonia sp. LY-0111]